MNRPLTRRSFLKSSAVLAGSVLAFPYVSGRNVLGANNRLNIAGIGIGGKGRSDILNCDSENIVALCDVDTLALDKMSANFPAAKRYFDWRVMFDEMGKSIDAVTVSTPDHMHFLPAMRAIKEGKHVYCQKPLTHTVWEARELAKAARRAGVATQMGNQGISHPRVRRDAELLKAGVLGDIVEFHCWTDRPGEWWLQGLQKPTEFPPVPDTLKWDLWLGGAAARPYSPLYAPKGWRGWWDFGTGAIGDMGCHLLNTLTLVKDIRDPVRIEGSGEGQTEVSGPTSSHITWQFPARDGEPAWKMHWYDGGRKPPADLFPGQVYTNNGQIVIGTKDVFYSRGYNGGGFFKSGATYQDFAHIPETLPKTQNWDRNHNEEWIAACKGGPKTYSNFDVAGPVTEVVLLGQVALRAQAPIEWNAKRMKVTNVKSANRFIRSKYRKGWAV
jgi:Predicted dehydrogenases and related proteins